MQGHFERTITALDNVFEFLDSFVGEQHINADVAYLLAVATEELFTNLVKYNATGAPLIDMTLERNGDEITLQISDHGVEPFDITTCDLPSIDAPLERRGRGQMGLRLVRSIADALEYHHRDGDTTIILRKSLRNPYVHSSH